MATKLKTLQSKYDPLADSSERRQPDIIQNFQTWCTQNNVTFEGLEIRHTTTMGRGIFAVNDLEPDSEVINVPKRAMLSLIESKSFFADTELIPEEIIELLKVFHAFVLIWEQICKIFLIEGLNLLPNRKICKNCQICRKLVINMSKFGQILQSSF